MGLIERTLRTPNVTRTVQYVQVVYKTISLLVCFFFRSYRAFMVRQTYGRPQIEPFYATM
jgi:hypothetical protein